MARVPLIMLIIATLITGCDHSADDPLADGCIPTLHSLTLNPSPGGRGTLNGLPFSRSGLLDIHKS
jgi:hypothetical protein